MPITDPIPTTYRRAATFATILFAAASRALVPIELAVVCIGTRTTAGTVAAATPFEVFDATDADTKAGKGSPLALMLRKCFEQGARQGVCPRIFGVGVAAPSGTAHVKTLTVTGPATADGNLVVRIAGRTITVGVANGDAQNTIAAALELAIDAVVARGELPVTAGVSTNVVSCTHIVHGENGADVVYEVVQAPAGVSVALGNSASGAGVIDITAALDALLPMTMHMGIAIENRKSADVTDLKAATAVAWGPGEKKYRWGFLGDCSTLSAATTLGAASNDKTVVIVSCEASPSLAGELAAAAAVKAFSKSLPNANLDFEELAIYPPPAASAYTTAEIESALAAGVTPVIPTDAGDAVMIQRCVTTKTLTDSAPDETQTDLAYSRTAAYMSTQWDLKLRAAFGTNAPEEDRLMTATTLARMRDVGLEVNRAAESLSIIQDVEALKGQVQVTEAATPAYRALATNAYRVVSGAHQVSLITTQYL